MRTITAQRLNRRLDAGPEVLLVNVLEEEKFVQAHIPGSYNVPNERDDFVEEVGRLLGAKDRPMVVYCADKACEASRTAARRLAGAGFTDVTRFAGGVAEWRLADLPVETGTPSHAHSH